MVNTARLLRRLDVRSDRWLVAVGSVLLALSVKIALGPITADAPLLLFFGAVILSARLGGFGAGVLATGLSAVLADFTLTPPYWQFDPSLSWLLRVALFVGEGVFISAAAQTVSMNGARQRVRGAGAAPSVVEASGALGRDARPVRISTLVRELMASMQESASAKGVCLETVIDHGTGVTQGDRDRLRQVVASLVSNAIKFTPAGGRVCVRVRRRRQDVELSVVDTGEGIAEHDLEQIFLPSRSEAGSLAKARQQVRLHGGEMTAYSAGPGTGATFTVRLRRMLFAPSAREPHQQLAV